MNMGPIFKTLEFFWPPVGLLCQESHLFKSDHEKREEEFEKIKTEYFKKLISQKIYCQHFLSEVDKIEQGGLKRKETLESKAYSILGSIEISAILLIFISTAVFASDWKLPKGVLISIVIVFGLAIIHLLTSVYYATKVIMVGEYFIQSSESVDEWIENEPSKLEYLVAQKYANSKMNQPIMISKSNFLTVAQKLFIRSVMFLSIGTLLIFVYSLIW